MSSSSHTSKIKPRARNRGTDGAKISISQSTKSDLQLTINDRPEGRDFTFTLKGNHLRVEPGAKGKGSDETDWHASLTDEEKILVMNKVLANYREPSLNRDKWKVSAIGIVDNPQADVEPPKRHLAFVGVNTDLRHDSLDKDCAEQGMLNSLVNHISQYQYHKRGVTMEKPAVPMELHLMGGRDPNKDDPNDKGEKMIAPCGKCTDTLGEWMDPNSYVYIYPANPGGRPLTINDGTKEEGAKTIAEVKDNEVWKTTIGHLNRYRHIYLSEGQRIEQKEAFNALAKELLAPPVPATDEVIARTADNKRHDIDSVPELDVATKNAVLDPAVANAHLHNLIVKTLRTRMRREGVEANEAAARDWLKSGKITSISATIVQYDDGTYTDGLKAQTAYDGSSANSQLSGVNSTDAVIKTGDNHVTRMWSMNFSPADVVNGMTSTPSKDGIERIIKKMNGNNVEKPFTHFSFNNGDLVATELSARHFSREDLYPGGFRGSSWRVRVAGKDEQTCGHCH